jgi:hypothetical protein
VRLAGEGQEIEAIWVLDELQGHVGLHSGKRLREVGQRLALAVVEIPLDMDGKDVAAPAIGDGLADVPFPLRPRLNEV